MATKNDQHSSVERQPAESTPAPKKRFRIEKLEERIAPRRGKPPQSGNSGTDLQSGSLVY